MRKASQRVLVGQDLDAVVDALRRPCRPVEAGPRPSRGDWGVSEGRTFFWSAIQSRYCFDERPEGLRGGGTVGQLGEGLHAKLDVRDPGGGDALDLGRGNPAGAGGAAGPLGVDLGMRRDAVTDGILVDVAVLQVGDPLVPLLGGVALQVGPGNQRLGRVDDQPGLEDEPLVAQLVGARDAVIDQEDRDGAGARRGPCPRRSPGPAPGGPRRPRADRRCPGRRARRPWRSRRGRFRVISTATGMAPPAERDFGH